MAYKAEGSREERLALIETLLGKDADQILAQCIAHEAVAGNNRLSFLPLFYTGRRSTLFLFLESASLVSTTQDRVLLHAIAFLLVHKRVHSKWLPISHAPLGEDDLDSRSPLLDLSFVTDKWWPLVTGNKDRVASVSCLDQSSPPGSQRSAASAQELGAWRLHRLTTKTVEFSFTNRARFLANGEKNASARTDPFPGQAHIYDVLAT
ncbi:MAG: hypothetical protein JO331_09680 [Verrucomicrobia bacterium]|nr:hypothetical protein [Verrucomicrobiota bacterium]